MLRFYRNNYFVLGDTCSFLSSLGHLHGKLHIRYCLLCLSSARLFPVKYLSIFYQGKISTNRNENIFLSANPPPRRPIINMFTKVSMGAKFWEFMRIEKRSSVCVIYQSTNTNKYGSRYSQTEPGEHSKYFHVMRGRGWWCPKLPYTPLLLYIVL